MDDVLHSLLEQWENHLRDHPDADTEDFIDGIVDFDRDTIDRFQVAATKLKRIDRRLEQIGVDLRDSDRGKNHF